MRPTPVRLWHYSYRTALQIAAPRWPKTSERTQVNIGWGTETAGQPLPLGLYRSTVQLPPLNLSLFNQTLLGDSVAVPVPECQEQIKSEAEVIAFMGPYFLRVAEHLVPSYIQNMGLKGKIRFVRENPSEKSRPDCVIYFDEKPIISFDYKGPNCVREDEFEKCFAASVDEAKTKVAKQGTIAKRAEQGNQQQGDTLFRVAGITTQTERLTQTAVKYAHQSKTPMVIFYDLDNMIVMKPPPGMLHANEDLMEVRIWKEPQKSTENDLVMTPDNHVNVLIRHIVDMVCMVEAQKRTG